jgi:hypothetical protein
LVAHNDMQANAERACAPSCRRGSHALDLFGDLRRRLAQVDVVDSFDGDIDAGIDDPPK